MELLVIIFMVAIWLRAVMLAHNEWCRCKKLSEELKERAAELEAIIQKMGFDVNPQFKLKLIQGGRDEEQKSKT